MIAVEDVITKYYNRPCGFYVDDANLECHFCACYCRSGIETTPFDERKEKINELDIETGGIHSFEELELMASLACPCKQHITSSELHKMMDNFRENEQ